MNNKVKKIIITLATFVIVFILHILYFKITESSCAGSEWFQKYIKEEWYFLGISYALSFAFMAFAFLKFKKNRKAALKVAFSGGILTIFLWFTCFLFGCCGSPMLVVYLNLIGLSKLKLSKLILLIMTIVFIAIGYIWLLKKTPKGCCNGKPCKEDKE